MDFMHSAPPEWDAGENRFFFFFNLFDQLAKLAGATHVIYLFHSFSITIVKTQFSNVKFRGFTEERATGQLVTAIVTLPQNRVTMS